MRTWLIDTGPIVAFLDQTDESHRKVAECIEGFSGRLITTSAVIVESMHVASRVQNGARALSELVAASAMRVIDLCGARELAAAVELMEKYSDTPMDFADATLVLLAEGLNERNIVTLDRRGFSTYRVGSRRTFRLILDEN